MVLEVTSLKQALLSFQKFTNAKSSPTGESSDLPSPIQHVETEVSHYVGCFFPTVTHPVLAIDQTQ